ncbi:DNA-directed RNA polymerases I, II, and III subunit RPABC4 [Ascobolus immersus RN42]|uniref:DNA-directed RNA polymerases I, II, and III subunit RPABC4 n=1 Tax=Ascobolus immersus RN42 TaxID=1160509 RepID=A0A3N4I206_ASCIM|nr:DNA-directed RNA polymerases I, II, and III subunit RPABC4 [Ascobolus immersus RN42]
MSGREGFQPPQDGAIPNPLHVRGGAHQTGVMNYLCAECGVKVTLVKGEQIRCKECGHRVLYKQRTKRMVQFDAR